MNSLLPKAHGLDPEETFWDVSVFGESIELKANRIAAQIINHEEKTVITLEVSCPWTENRERKDQVGTFAMGS